MNKISAIICAYNEEKTLENVIISVAQSNLFDEIIIINDGSTDSTNNIILKLKKSFNLIDIHFTENKGKGYAMAEGIERAGGEILVFIDADLEGIKKKHLLSLIEPIIEKKADLVMGQPIIYLFSDYKINPLKYLTGERALYKKDILPIVDRIRYSKFGVETLINLYYKASNKKMKMVLLNGIKHYIKFEKTNSSKAFMQYLQAIKQILVTAINNHNMISKIIKNNIKIIVIPKS